MEPAREPEGRAAIPSMPVGQLEGLPEGERWLIEGLWAKDGVGIIGGTPKTGKTWLALDFALSVASGTPALGAFPVREPGTAVLFPAEDDPRAVRDRVAALATRRGVELANLPLHIITTESLKLDEPSDRDGLEQLLINLRPRLLVLDPLVRLHSGDENHSGHVSELLGYLRALQRRFLLSIIVTHHVTKKTGAAQPGQALRGSSDLHAWGDSNAYLRRQKDGPLLLTLEHRGAPSPEPMEIRLVSVDGGAQFELVGEGESSPEEGGDGGETLQDRILRLLHDSGRPVSQLRMRKRLRVRNQKLTEALRALEVDGRIQNEGRQIGWKPATSSCSSVRSDSVPTPTKEQSAGG